MTFAAFGGAEAGLAAANQGSGVWRPVTTDATVIATPFDAATGTYAYSIDPVNGNAGDQYGIAAILPYVGSPAQGTHNLFSIPFMYRFEADFDAVFSICELGQLNLGGNFARRLSQPATEGLQIYDETETLVGETAAAYVAADTDYWFLWYIDLRMEAASRDILWVWKAGAWATAIDVSNHGDGDYKNITGITFGNYTGKTRPTAGGPFYVVEQVVQFPNVTPNTTPIGSCTTAVLMPTGAGTEDGDFDAGVGAANPSHLNVDEIPPDANTTYDEGGTLGDQQSYEVADPGNTPLALQVIGAGGLGAGLPFFRPYIYYDGVRDYAGNIGTGAGSAYRTLINTSGVDRARTYNEVNGNPITEALVNASEPGIELTSAEGGATFRVSQIALETMIEGPKALPDDFPTLAEPRMVETQGQAAMTPVMVF